MIDYKKLQQAHELCFNTDYFFEVEFGNKSGFGAITLYHVHTNFEHHFVTFDYLIAKLHELTKPKTKYAVGQEVWRLCDLDSLQSLMIEDIDYASDEMYMDEDGNWWIEEQLYSTKEALIEAQIDYWYKIKMDVIQEKLSNCAPICSKNNEISTRSDDASMASTSECEHENEYKRVDGKMACRNCLKILYQDDIQRHQVESGIDRHQSEINLEMVPEFEGSVIGFNQDEVIINKQDTLINVKCDKCGSKVTVRPAQDACMNPMVKPT